ncbi:MAG: NAD(P)/FAD-dependent oxidoreductase [Bradymonadales bacterium]|nr:NAD(P)/FAD-dependent oxidoreductase [Bradymonadales bacterium]
MAIDFDVIVVGGGTAGTLCARSCARFGLRTALLERLPQERYGYPFVIEAERTAFHACQVPLPSGEEVAYDCHDIRVFANNGRFAFGISRPNTIAVRLGLTMRRFARYARQERVKVLWGTSAEAPLMDGTVVRGVSYTNTRLQSGELTARAVVDASGYRATLVKRLPGDCGIDFVDRPQDRVLAENRIYRIDRQAARQGAAESKFPPETVSTYVGMAGPYSTEMSLVSPSKGFAYILAGVKVEQSPPTPADLIERWKKRVGCCTEQVEGGGGVIRIRRPSLRLVCDGFAAVGEAASTVIPMHGSGVSSAMLTGHTLGIHLGELLSRGGSATTDTLWPWAASFQRGRGKVLAYYDALRRIVERFARPEEIRAMLLSGIMRGEDMLASSIPEISRPSLTSLPQRALALLRHPLMAARLAARIPTVLSVGPWWSTYPTTWDAGRFQIWKKGAERLLP